MLTKLKSQLFSWFECIDAHYHLMPSTSAERRVIRAYLFFFKDLEKLNGITEEEYDRFRDLLHDTVTIFNLTQREAIANTLIPDTGLRQMFQGALAGCETIKQSKLGDRHIEGLVPIYMHTCEVLVRDLWLNIQEGLIKRSFRKVCFIWRLPREALKMMLAIILTAMLLLVFETARTNSLHIIIGGWQVLLATFGTSLALWWLIGKSIQFAALPAVKKMISDIEQRARYSQRLKNYVIAAIVVWKLYPKLWTLIDTTIASPSFVSNEDI